MKILAIETSTKYLSLAIADEGSVLAEYKGEAILRHSQDLIPSIDALLRKIGLTLGGIDGFAISIGPGSFTGLRVGVSVLKGLNMATNIPIIAVPTLDVIAHNGIKWPGDICVLVDARKNNLYCSFYKKANGGIIRLWGYLLVSFGELLERVQRLTLGSALGVARGNQKDGNDILFLGDGAGLYKKEILEKIKGATLAGEESWYPDVKITACLAVKKFKNREFEDPDTLAPMYIYSSRCNIRGV